MVEQRRVRFASIDGLRRSDLPVAGEVWLDDVFASTWTTREAMKLATHLVRYMATPDPVLLSLSGIEGQLQLGAEQTKFALRLMQMYGAVEAYAIEKDQVRVALHLSMLQRLRALETRHRLDELTRAIADEPPVREARWVPEAAASCEVADDTLAAAFEAELRATG